MSLLKNYIKHFLIIALTFYQYSLSAQISFEWVHGPHSPNIESGNSLVVDSVNHFVYLAGLITEPISDYNIGASDLKGGNDGFIAKYDFNGQVIWAFNLGGSGNDEIHGITIDNAGNICVTGYYSGNIDLSGNVITSTVGNITASYGGTDIFVAGYNPNGGLLFYNVFGGMGDDAGIDICSNQSGFFITGYYSDSMAINGQPSYVPYNNKNIFVSAIDFSGNLLWATGFGSDANDAVSGSYQKQNMSITADSQNVYVIGLMGGNNFLIYNNDGIIQDILFNNDTYQNLFILALNNSTSNLFWAQQIENDTNSVGGMGIAANSNGIYITGMTNNNSIFPGAVTISASSASFAFLSKLNKNIGNTLWIKLLWGNSLNNDIGYAVTSDNNHGIYVCGKYKSNPFHIDADTTFNNANQSEVFVAKYIDNGNFQWAINATDNGNETGLDIMPYRDESAFVSGMYSYKTYFPNYYFITNDTNNIFLGKLPGNKSSGILFDVSGCTGDIDSNGYITTVNDTNFLEIELCQHVKICEDFFIANPTDVQWLDSVYFNLGNAYTNITNITPNGNNNGFYQQGNWSANYDATNNAIAWSFNNTYNPLYGDGYSNASGYSCAIGNPHYYKFCFEADIPDTIFPNQELDILMTVIDDGFSFSGPGPLTTASTLVNEITINDSPPQFISCQTDTTIYLTSVNNCSSNVSWTPPTATDNCNYSITQTEGPPNGSLLSIGEHQISYVVTDTLNQTDTCSFTIYVVDTIPPQINCPSNQTRQTEPNNCFYTVQGNEFNPVTLSDNCSIVSVYNNFNNNSTLDGSTFQIGNHDITWYAIDSSGNIDSCSFTVTVADTTIPVISCPPNQNVYVNNGCEYIVQGNEFNPVTLSDNCSIASVYNNFNNDSTLDSFIFQIGTHNITWYAIDSSGNIDSCSFTVTVADTTIPVISCPPNQNVYVNNSCEYIVQGNEFDPVALSDNCSIVSVYNNFNNDPTLDGFIFQIGDHDITWYAEDSSGNINSCSFIVTVIDTTIPVMSCPLNQNVYVNNGCEYIVQGNEFDPVALSDNCSIVSVYNNFNNDPTLDGFIFQIGDHDITWYAEDSSGNINSCSFIVTVADTVTPVITCQGNLTFYSSATDCNFTPLSNELDPIFSDNCSISNITNDYNGTNSLNGQQFLPNSYNILWTATDSSGNINSCLSSFTVIDTIPPVFDWPQDIVTCDSVVTWNAPVAYDNCSVVNVVQTDNTQLTSGSVFPVGITTIEYTATDSSNNSQTATFNVNVLPPPHPYWGGLPSQVCLTDTSIVLQTLITGDTSGTWTIDGFNLSTFVPENAGIGNHTITYHLNNGYCSADSSLLINVTDLPYVNAGQNFEVCGKETVLSGYTSTSITSHYWNSVQQGIEFLPDSTSLNANVIAQNFDNYILILTSQQSITCFNKDTVEISFYEQPDSVFAGEDQQLNIIDETYMQAQLPNIGTGSWSFYQGLGIIANSTSATSFVSQLNNGENILEWKVTNGPCEANDYVSIFVKKILIPDAFSPNGDGYNDYYVIEGIESMHSDLTIFNRWGLEVFHANNYQNDWNGTDKTGKELPEDTYFFILQVNNKTFNGSITLNR